LNILTVELTDAGELTKAAIELSRRVREFLLPDGYTLVRVGQDGWQATAQDGWTGPVRTHRGVQRTTRTAGRIDSKTAAWASGDAWDRATAAT
jgi:hypothetical protein